MSSIIGLIIIIFVLIWASRLEIGMNKANESLERIEKQLNVKKEKK